MVQCGTYARNAQKLKRRIFRSEYKNGLKRKTPPVFSFLLIREQKQKIQILEKEEEKDKENGLVSKGFSVDVSHPHGHSREIKVIKTINATPLTPESHI